jgi:hypothetical protein
MKRYVFIAMVLAATHPAAAQTPAVAGEAVVAAEASVRRSAGIELNVAWPFLGISEARFVIPVFDTGTQRGAVIAGVHIDYQQRGREDMGLFRNHAAKVGYRHYVWRGLHVEAAFNIGWVHVTNNPVDSMDYDELGLSAWLHVGYEWALGSSYYVNVRPTLGYRLSDQPWPNGVERGFINGIIDANLGLRF